MSGARRWLPEAGTVLALLILISPLLPSVMRETDQASVVKGAYEIAFRHSSLLGSHFYHYDKMLGSYLVLAGLFRILPAIDPVTVANLFQAGLWLGTTIALLLRGSRLPPLVRVLMLATMFSTVWVLSIPFFAPAAISAYTLLCAFLIAPRGWASLILEALLVFLATSFRADAALLLPFLVWNKSRRTGALHLLTSPRTVTLAIAAGTALSLGRVLAGEWSVFATPPRVIPKVLLAFVVFGLGPAALTFACVLGALIWNSGRTRARAWYVGGLVSFSLPLAYYGPQLLSPRYLLLTVAVTLGAFTSRRMVALLCSMNAMTAKRSRVAIAISVVLAAIVPIAVGLQLPLITSPRLTVGRATTYPTADGHWPMGAVVGFAYATRHGSNVSIDHNQGIYEAARSTAYQSLCHGRVPVLRTPMASYLELALTLKGLRVAVIDHAGQRGCENAYADLRSLTHEWLHPFEPDASPNELPALRVVSRPLSNQPIVLIGQEDDPVLRRELTVLRNQFRGREFEVLFRRTDVVGVQPGSVYQLVAPTGFTAEALCADLRHRVSAEPIDELYAAAFTTDRIGCTIELPSRNGILVAHTILAPYMDLR